MSATLSIRLALLAALLPLVPAAAFAAAATTTQSVNLRSGPSTTYGVTGQLPQGAAVDVRQCEGLFCQIAVGDKTGWVSASFLTRGGTPKVPAANAGSPQIATTQPTTKPKSAAAPVVGAVPAGSFPPAYDDTTPAQPSAGTSPGYASTPLPPLEPTVTSSPGYVTAPPRPIEPSSSNDDNYASSDDSGVPRPQVDVPGGARSGPDDEFANDNGSSYDDNSYPADGNNSFASSGDNAYPADDGNAPPADIAGAPTDSDGFTIPAPGNSDQFDPQRPWRGDWGPFARHRHYARLGDFGAPAQACFFDANTPDRAGFCLREGQQIAGLGDWSYRPLRLDNPHGLEVTICSGGGRHDCHIYADSGPLAFNGRDIGSISVAAPGH